MVRESRNYRGKREELVKKLVGTNAKQVRSRSSGAARCFMCVCLQAQAAVHAGNIRTGDESQLF